MVRTLVEIQANGWVTVKVDDKQVDGETSTSPADLGTIAGLRDRVLDLEAEITRRQEHSDVLLFRIRELEKDRERTREGAALALNARNQFERERNQLSRERNEQADRANLAEMDRDRFKTSAHELNERAAAEKARAELAEAALADAVSRLGDRSRDLAEAKTRAKDMENRLAESDEQGRHMADVIGKIRGAVLGGEIRKELDLHEHNGSAQGLTAALREVRRIVGA